jgi:Sulfotransferase family
MQASITKNTFRGPIFIVGMPRSGTKLMRSLLNQHAKVSITLAESHFIPYFIKRFDNPPLFNNREHLHIFVDQFLQTTFFHTMRKAGYNLNKEDFINAVDYTSWSSIFEYILRDFGSKRGMMDVIWGDKTPGYINHMDLLKQLFPQAKFLHMIRDPRDYCLSVKKSWNKSIVRAAHRWKETVGKAREYGKHVSTDYMEVYYERLLEDPEKTMQAVSYFLGCEYDDRTTKLTEPSEDLGDAKGQARIVTDNTKKYLTQFAPYEVRRIEEIVCDVARSANYVLENDVHYRPLNPLNLKILELYDGLSSLKYHTARENGLSKGAKRFFIHYTKSSWR